MPSSSLLEKCCLVGESVAGNPTHFMIERAFAAAELDWRFLTFEVASGDLGAALRGLDALGFRGVMLLPSLRDEAADLATNITERVRRTGAVSCLARGADEEQTAPLSAHNLTGPALTAALEGAGAAGTKHALLLGGGRPAVSLGDALLERGAASLTITDPDPARCEEIRSRLAPHWPKAELIVVDWVDLAVELREGVDTMVAAPSWPSYDDIIGSKALGDRAAGVATCVDARVAAGRTPLLHTASEDGAVVIDGVQLMVEETELALGHWAGLKINREVLRDAAEEFLGV